jgi:hypothetical protein
MWNVFIRKISSVIVKIDTQVDDVGGAWAVEA